MTEPIRKKNTGEAGNPGEFGSKSNTDAPDGMLTVQTPTTRLDAVFERWDNRDNAIEVGRQSFDARQILDTMPLEEVEKLGGWGHADTHDHVYEAAETAGLFPHHDGPYTLSVNDLDLDEYVEFRRDHGLTEPIGVAVPFEPAGQREFIGAALGDAYSGLRISWVLSATSRGAQAHVRKSFNEAAEQLRAALADPRVNKDTVEYNDNEAIRRVINISEGTDPRGGTFHDQAAAASAWLADYLLRRQAEA